MSNIKQIIGTDPLHQQFARMVDEEYAYFEHDIVFKFYFCN